MLCIVAYHGLKARCIAVLLHTRMSHTGRTTSGWTSVLRRPEWNGDFEPAIPESESGVLPITPKCYNRSVRCMKHLTISKHCKNRNARNCNSVEI